MKKTNSSADGGIKITKGFMMIVKGERIANLYKLTESIIVSDTSVATEKKNATRLCMSLGHMSERGLQTLHEMSLLAGIKYCKLDLCKFCIIGWQHRVTFSTS